MQVNTEYKPRVVIYGVGLLGQHIVRIASQKGWPIVAAFNRAGNKVGKDLGALAGLERTLGIIVQDCDQAEYGELNADIGVVAMTNRLGSDMQAYRRLLSAGLNVVSFAGEACFPYSFDKTLVNEIDTLAKRNKVSFTGTGIWDLSRIWAGIMVAGPCTDISALYHKSITDTERYGEPLMLSMGVGMTQAEFSEKILKTGSTIKGQYQSVLEHVLSALGYTPTQATEHIEPVLFDKPVYSKVFKQTIVPRVVCGTRTVAKVETAEGVTAEAHIEVRLFQDGEVEHMLWSVEGQPSTSIRIERNDSAYSTASSVFNRIPDVIAAAPGIQLISKMGVLKHTALL